MTTEEIKQFLRSYQRAKTRRRELLKRIKELEEVLTSVSIDYSSAKVQGGTAQDLSDKIAKLSDFRAENVNAAFECIEHMERVCKVIDALGGTYADILHRRYIEGERWEEIAVALHYTYRNVTRLHGKALLALKDFLECPK